jgi:hypothetical protein
MDRLKRSTGENIMGKAVRLLGIGAVASAAILVMTGVGAQVGVSLNAAGSNPGMPQAVSPKIAMQPMGAQTATAPQGAPSTISDSDMRQKNTLRTITEKKAELELLKIQADIDKFKKPQEDAAKKEEGASLQAALEQAKKEQSASAPAPVAVDPGPTVLLLATFGSPELPSMGYAEFKVGDLLVHAKVGDRLPSGHYLKAVHFDSVEISKAKKAKSGKVIYISPADTVSVYGSRAKSGASLESAGNGAAGALGVGQNGPSGLPPMPANR